MVALNKIIIVLCVLERERERIVMQRKWIELIYCCGVGNNIVVMLIMVAFSFFTFAEF